jgi:putative addiction module component (TIGR02574 family)
MSTTIQSLGIDHLDRDQRIALVLELWDSIVAEGTLPELTEPQASELQRRVAEDDATPEDVVPWEQVKARAQARLQT